ncbi:MAG: hypothetical protein L0212_09950 [Acidobacteria bacterium]|nr:hypothetical protein [Acidobacteriota bacterium]
MPRQIAALLPLAVLVTALLLASSPALAQEKAAEKALRAGTVYKVDFAVREKEDGTTVNTRSYVMLLENTAEGKVRASNRVPIPYEKGFQYMDVGLSLDCRIVERDADLSVDIRMEISDFAGQEKTSPPLVRSIRSEVKTGIPLGKPTVVSVVDDTATKRRYELEVTATKVK